MNTFKTYNNYWLTNRHFDPFEHLKYLVSETRRRKLGNHTYLRERYPLGSRRKYLAIQYHNTDVVTYECGTGRCTLNNGGWFTVTTKARMNQHMPPNTEIMSHHGYWFVKDSSGTVIPYRNGVRFHRNGTFVRGSVRSVLYAA